MSMFEFLREVKHSEVQSKLYDSWRTVENAAKPDSQKRYAARIVKWAATLQSFSLWRHWFWWMAHNCLAHPMLGFDPTQKTVAFHDLTSRKLNLTPDFGSTPMPVITNYWRWFVHNCLVHPLIGLLPFPYFFELHDRSAKWMNVKYWV